jgi:hypothetical protein
MDLLTTLPPVVGSLSSLCADASQALAARLLTIALAALIISGVGVFAMAAFAWLWLKRLIGDLHLAPLRALPGA